jgi:arylsulfatase
LPVFETGKGQEHEWMFWEHQNNCAVRHGKWKAIQKFDTGKWELYNIEEDRTELHNLAADKPEVINELSQAWHAWAKAKQVIPK